MKIELVSRVLESTTGIRKDGAAFLISEECELSIYIALPSEVLTIPRVSRFQPSPDLVTIETTKGERFYFGPDLIAGVKVGSGESKGIGRGAGFR